jgi:hypothetical protein
MRGGFDVFAHLTGEVDDAGNEVAAFLCLADVKREATKLSAAMSLALSWPRVLREVVAVAPFRVRVNAETSRSNRDRPWDRTAAGDASR